MKTSEDTHASGSAPAPAAAPPRGNRYEAEFLACQDPTPHYESTGDRDGTVAAAEGLATAGPRRAVRMFASRRFLPMMAILGCGGGIALLVAGELEKGRVFLKNRPTHADLAARQAKATGKTYEAAGLELLPPGTIKPGRGPKNKSLFARSTTLSSGAQWTIVPKGAVLHIPKSYHARVNGNRTGKLVDWLTFRQRNRGWIYTVEVSMDQARGDTPIPPETVEAYQRLGRVVVATCQRGPISVKEPKKPASEPVTTP